MIRALITAALLTGIAVHFGAPPEAAAGYIFVTVFALWFAWPALRRHRRRRRRPASPRSSPAARPTAQVQVPSLTQINHYHFYGSLPAARQQYPVVDPSQLAIPQYSEQQIAHNKIFEFRDQ